MKLTSNKSFSLTTFGFTLIELLAVIIILSIVALIATPIILDVVEDARISAGKSESNMIYSGINNYCASINMKKQMGTLDSEDVDCTTKTTFTDEELSKMINLGNADIKEIAYDGERLTTLVIESNNHIFKLCDGTFVMDSECEITTEPKINITYDSSLINSNGWAKEDIAVTIQGNGEIKYCMSDNTCEPNEVISNGDNTKFITSEGTTNICGVVSNSLGTSEVLCKEFKLDKTIPMITAKSDNIEITEGDSNQVSDYFEYSYGISGGSISCSPINTSSLSVGNQTVNCTVTGNNGLINSASKSIVVKSKLPESISFASDSWETIAAIVKAGKAEEFYNVGDEKEVAISGYGTFTVRIANMSTPAACSTEGFSQTACGFVVEFVDIIAKYEINKSNGTIPGTIKGGWPASDIYDFVNGTIYNALSMDLKEVIINTKTISGYGEEDSKNFTSTDKLYLLSSKEIWGTIVSGDTTSNEIRQLDYYKNHNVTLTNNYSNAIKIYQGNAYKWWTRSVNVYGKNCYYVENTGKFSDDVSYQPYGVAPAFRIG